MQFEWQTSRQPRRPRRTRENGARDCLHVLLFLVVAALSPAVSQSFGAPEHDSYLVARLRTTTQGRISGIVRSASAGPLAGVRITLVADGTGSRQFAVTGSEGRFIFAVVEPGSYTIQAEAAGFQKSARSHLVLGVHQHLVADLSLAPDGSKALTASHTRDAKNAPSASLGEFNYYDAGDLKPGKVNASVDPGGYSSAQEVDSYSLMLDYVEAQGAELSGDTRNATAPGASSLLRHHPEAPPTVENSSVLSESEFLARGSQLMLNRDVVNSIQTFQAGVGRFPESAKLQTGLGIALLGQGEHERAIASLLRAVDLAPSDPRPYYVLAKAYRGSSAPNAEVSRRLERLLELEPRSAQARYYYALSLAKASPRDDPAWKRMESMLESAVTLDPSFAEAHLELGSLYSARSKYPEAIEQYRSAVRLKPGLAAAHYRLAQAYTRTGDKVAAQSELESYERLRKSSPAAPR